MPFPQRHLGAVADWDREAVMGEALRRVGEQGSTWLHADVGREIATLVPPEAATSATEMVEIVDRLAGAAMARCIELHPPELASVPLRRDGRPVTEHATDRRVSTEAILTQEARLLSWAQRSVGAAPSLTDAQDAQRSASEAVAGADRLVLVIGPAGAGKTTALAMAVAELGRQGRAVVGLAPSGKAADVLATEARCGATTVAKFLHDLDGRGASFQRPPAGATVIVDEAGMCATEDLDRLVTLADDNGWRLVCVGDPAQLPAVGRGGMFEQWCETGPAHHLDDVRRFADHWQGPASLDLRKGKAEAVEVYAAHHCLDTVHPSVVADRVARRHQELTHGSQSLAITCASSSTARKINVAIQHRRNRRQVGPSLALRDRTRVFVGDTVATRHNDARLVTSSGATVRNRHTWTVTAVGDDGTLTVADPTRGEVVLPESYVRRHVELGWAVTGYGSQGITTDHGICVVERSSSRAGVYVGMTRGRVNNEALVLDRTGEVDAAEELAAIIGRPAHSLTAHMARDHLYRAKGLEPPALASSMRPEDPSRRMAERLNQLAAHRPPAHRLSR